MEAGGDCKGVTSIRGAHALLAAACIELLMLAWLVSQFCFWRAAIFVTIGRLQRAPVVRDDGSVGRREVFTPGYAYDERVADGFYAARALERLQALEEPERLIGIR